MLYEPWNTVECKTCGGKHDKFQLCYACEKKKRLADITCPVCKSDSIGEGGIYSSNGIMGPGYHSTNNFPHLYCMACGVVFYNMKQKDPQA